MAEEWEARTLLGGWSTPGLMHPGASRSWMAVSPGFLAAGHSGGKRWVRGP